MPDTQQIDAEVAAIIAAPHNDLPPSVRVDETVLQPTATTTAQPLVMTADAIPAMLDDPAFQALPFERKSQLAEDALAEAGRQVSQSWDKEQFVDWGKFAEKVRSKVGEQDTLLNQTGRAVRDLGEGAINMGTSLAKDAGTVAISAADAINPGGSGFGVPALKTMGSGFMAGLESLKASGKSVLAGGGEAETNLQTSLDSLKKDIDEGNLPLDDPQKFSEWLTSHDTELADARSKFFADAESGLTRGLSIPEPTEAQRAVAKTTGLASPDNQKLIAAYMQTRSPETWKALQQQLFKTPEMQAAEASKADVLKTPGAVEFNKAFGEGASEHLLSASNPLMIAGFALPMLRGAAGAEAAAAEAGLMGAAKQVATGAAKAAPEMAGFGAVQQLEQNPQSTAGEVAQSAAEMAGAGAILAGATGGVGTIAKRGLNAGETGNTGLPAATVEGEILFEAPKPPETPPVTPQFVAASTLANKFGGAPAMSHVARTQALVEEMNRRGPATGTIIPRPQKLYTAAELQGKQWPEPLPPETAPASGEPTAPITQETSPAPSTQTEGVIPNETTNPNPQPSAENLNVPAATRTAEAPVTGEPPPSTTATTLPEGTSNKEAVVNAERALRSLTPIPKEDVIKNTETLERGAKAVETNPNLPTEIVERLRKATPQERTISLDDSGALIIERVKLNTERDKQAERAADPKLTEEERAVAKSEWDRLEGKINDLDQAAQDARSVWGRFGQFWQRLVKNDFTLEAIERKARAAKGAPLTAEESASIAADTAKLAELTKEIEGHRATEAENESLKHQNAELQKLLDAAGKKKATKPAVEKEPQDYVPKKPFGSKVIEYADKRTATLAKDIKGLISGRANIGLDPTLLAKVVEYGALKLTKGAVKFSRWAADMKAELGEWIDEHLKDLWTQAKAKVSDFAAAAGRDIEGERAATVATMKKRVSEGDSSADLHRYARALAKQFIDEGITELEPLNAAVHDVLKDIVPGITEAESRDAWSGYGQWKPLDKEPGKVILRERSTESQKLSTYERLKAGLAGLRTGAERQPPTERARAMEKANKKLQKELGIEATDPAKQLKSTLDGIKTRLGNEIADMDFAMATGKRMVKDKSGVSLDTEAQALKDARDAKKILYDAVFPKEKISDAEALRRATILAERDLENWNKKLENAKNGIFDKREGPVSTVPGERLQEVLDQVKAAKAEVEHLKDLDSAFQETQTKEKLQKTGDALEKRLRDGETALENDPMQGPDSAEVAALKARNADLRKAIADAKRNAGGDDAKTTAALERAIAKTSAELASGETKVRTGKASRPDTEKNARLRDELAALQEFKADIKRAATPRKSDAEIRLQGMRAAALRRIADLADRRRRGDFEPKAKKPPPVARTPEEKELQRKLDKALVAKAKIEKGFEEDRMKDRLAKRTKAEKVSNFISGLTKANVLSHISVIEHLVGAALENIITRPISSTVGQLMRLNKTLDSIRRKTPYEGGWGGEGAALRTTLSLRTMKAALQKLRHGKSDLDWLHDTGKVYPKHFLEIVGNSHAFIKEPIRQGIYAKAMELGTKAAQEKGLDPASDPVLASAISADAYRLANEDIFMGDNFLTKAVHRGITGILRGEKNDPGLARVTADVLDILFPVVNVPINIAIRKFRLFAGLPEAAVRIGSAASKGELRNSAERLSAKDAEQITRAFKYGATGLALSAYAWTHPQYFGGVFALGQNAPHDKDNHLAPGEIALPDGSPFSHISHHFAHGPWGGHMNMMADARRLYDSIVAKGGNQWTAMGEAAFFRMFSAGLKDLPQFSTIGRLTSPYQSAGQKAGEMAKNVLIPGLLQDAAKWDVFGGDELKRSPKTFTDEMKSGIPYLREDVPLSRKQ